MNKDMVAKVIQQRQAEIRKCYTDALEWNPELKGRLLIRFSVEEDGQVSAASEPKGEKFPDEVVVQCVVSEFLQLRFPPGPQSFNINYPMVFTPPAKPAR